MVAAVVLAAGAGSRFSGPEHKLRTMLGSRTILQHAVGAAVESGLEVIVVTGAISLSDLLPASVIEIHNDQWARGQANSARLAVAEAARRGHDAVIVGLGDQPFLAPEAWRLLAAADDVNVAIATYDGVRGHPVRLGARVWPEIPAFGDSVGRAILADHADEVREIACGGQTTDIDTVEELFKWS